MRLIDGVRASIFWTFAQIVGFQRRKLQALPEVEDDSYAARAADQVEANKVGKRPSVIVGFQVG